METIARYENTSQVINNAEQDIVQLFPNLCRDRVNLAASIKDVLPVRDALLALRDCITSKLYTSLEEIQLASLDPLITVTQERIFFEAFSLDEASYGRVSIQLEALNSIDVLTQGCTNIEFSEKLRQGLQQLRSSQPAWLAVERKAFSLNTGKSNIIEKRIVLPPSWMRGFLEVQASLQRPATTVSFAPGDLLNILTYLKKRKENVSPRSLRFQFEPNSPPKAVVEPWNEVFIMRRSKHLFETQEEIRIWGRRRLFILEKAVTQAKTVKVFFHGSGRSSFWLCNLGTVSFLLALSPWTEKDWTKVRKVPKEDKKAWQESPYTEQILFYAKEKSFVFSEELSHLLKISQEETNLALNKLCFQGRVLFDIETGAYFLRDIFPEKNI